MLKLLLTGLLLLSFTSDGMALSEVQTGVDYFYYARNDQGKCAQWRNKSGTILFIKFVDDGMC